MTGRMKFILPAALFLAFGAALLYAMVGADGGRRNPSLLPSALLNKPAPDFALAGLPGLGDGLKTADLKGGVTVVNFFASWCPPCLVEHPQLVALAKDKSIRVYGVNYKDKDDKAAAWLKEHGNPFARIGVDRDGRVAIDWGNYGVPETYFLDKDGIIRHRHVGPLTERDMKDDILPLLERLKK
jgi:cytochrome c biogenesis protein CcmG/thiol:disulfide interchange protein DsbE